MLSFAIIMLNTSLHNPSVKDKPTVDRFISMNRGINDGKDLPDDLLTVSYQFVWTRNTNDSLKFLQKREGMKSLLYTEEQ